MYLFIIIDWYTRQIVDYELSYSLSKDFVMRCLRRAFLPEEARNHELRPGNHLQIQTT